MGLELIGFAGGLLVGALGTCIWLHERFFTYVEWAEATNKAVSGISGIARRLRLRDNAPARITCPNCGSDALTPCGVPFLGQNSQN